MKKHATALRAFSHAADTFAAKQVILNMDGGQFADWSAPGVDLVREATDAEVAAARGDKPADTKKPSRPRAKAKVSPAPAPAPVLEKAPDAPAIEA
jgi:hypothetical protein